jgi:archaeal cell division control protein 6
VSLFDDMLGFEESLFKEEIVLDFQYIPELIPHREGQQEYIANSIKPLAQGRSGKGMLVHGAPGIGKTSCVRFIFSELAKSTGTIKPVYINCWKKPTNNAVLVELASQLGCIGAHYKSNEEIWVRIEAGLKRFKGVVIALDEVDKSKENDFLYQIVENIKPATIILITNEEDFLAEIDPRVRSRMVLEDIEFPEYKRNEVQDILAQRLDAAFVEGVWSDEAFELVVDKTYAKKDIRTGLFIMREAGRLAERDSLRKIGVDQVMTAIGKLADFMVHESGDLNEREQRVFEMIKQNNGVETGELSRLLRESRGDDEIPDSTLRRIIQKLDKGGYIFREDASVEGRGKTMRHFVDE